MPDGTYLFEDKLTVSPLGVAPGATPTLTQNDGNLLDATGNPIPVPNNGFVLQPDGTFDLQFYTRPSTPATVSVELNGITMSFTTASCTVCPTTSTSGGCSCSESNLKSGKSTKHVAKRSRAIAKYPFYTCIKGKPLKVWAERPYSNYFKTYEECLKFCNSK